MERDILSIIRAIKAFKDPVQEEDILDYCAELSGREHGDVKHTIEQLRVATGVTISGEERRFQKMISLMQTANCKKIEC